MKSNRLPAVAFVAMLLGCSFCNSAVAQSGDGFVAQFMEASLKQKEGGLQKAGVISSTTEQKGKVYVCTLLLDEAVVTVDMMGVVIDVALGKSNTEGLFGKEEGKTILEMEAQGVTCRCVVRGNGSGAEIVRDMSVREFLAFGKYLSGDEAIAGEPSIDDIVAMIDGALVKDGAKNGTKMRCVRRDDVVYIEHEVPASEYEDMKDAMKSFGWLVKRMVRKALSGEKEVVESFRLITKLGCSFAYAVCCGDNEPVIIELDL